MAELANYVQFYLTHTKNVMNIINLPCRIIEVLDNRGPDNRGSTALLWEKIGALTVFHADESEGVVDGGAALNAAAAAGVRGKAQRQAATTPDMPIRTHTPLQAAQRHGQAAGLTRLQGRGGGSGYGGGGACGSGW